MIDATLLAEIEHYSEHPGRTTVADYCRHIRLLLEERKAERQRCEDLAMMLRRVLTAVAHGCFGRKAKPPLVKQAWDLLTRLGFQGTPLREDEVFDIAAKEKP